MMKNEEVCGHKGELIAIVPNPNEVLRAGFPGLSKLITKKVEEIDLSLFKERKENDILFIDSRGCPTIQKLEKKEGKYWLKSKKKQNFLCQKQL
jgi:hypothetical protein